MYKSFETNTCFDESVYHRKRSGDRAGTARCTKGEEREERILGRGAERWGVKRGERERGRRWGRDDVLRTWEEKKWQRGRGKEWEMAKKNREGHREDGGERRAEGEAQPSGGRGETHEGSESKVFSDAHALISRCKKFVYTWAFASMTRKRHI